MSKKPYLSVNNFDLSIQDVHTFMQMLDGYDVRLSLQYQFSILEYATSQNVKLEQSEIQDALDTFRYEMELGSAHVFEQWKRDHKITTDALHRVCQINAFRKKLLSLVPQQEIKELFNDIQDDETLFCLFVLSFEDGALAQKTADEINNNTLTFAQAVSQYGDRITRSSGGYLGEIARTELPKIYKNSIISVEPETLVGPILDEDEWVLVYLSDRIEPEFEDYEQELREALLDQEFKHIFDRTVVIDKE